MKRICRSVFQAWGAPKAEAQLNNRKDGDDGLGFVREDRESIMGFMSGRAGRKRECD